MIYKSILCLLVLLLPQYALGDSHAQTVTPFHRDRATVAAQYNAATLGLDPSKGLRWQFYWSANNKKTSRKWVPR